MLFRALLPRAVSSRHAARSRATTRAGSTYFDVVVIGGGASGIFGAIAAARTGASVLVLESGSAPLRKVKVSGGGRCNVMHDETTWEPRGGRELLKSRYPRGASQLLGILSSRFSPVDTAAWFRAEGVELKREADGRVFPCSDDSATVVTALLAAADRAGVRLRRRCKVRDVRRLGTVGKGCLPCGSTHGAAFELRFRCE